MFVFFFFFKQKTAYEIYQCDWSSDVCSSDLINENSPDHVDEILVHEMLHILLRDLTSPLNALLRTQDAQDIFYQINELLVIRLENAFALRKPTKTLELGFK